MNELKKYSVVVLLNKDGSKVLLCKKDHTAYAGRLNGVGGAVADNEMPWENALRKIFEETSIHKKDIRRFTWLGTLSLPEQCDFKNPDKYPELWFFSGIVDDESLAKTPELRTERIDWVMLVGSDPVTELDLAGDGDLEYFIGKARRMLFGNPT